MTHSDIIKFIEAQSGARGIAPATFCRLAVGNNRLFRNLKGGGSCTIEIAQRLFAYASDNPPSEKGTAE